MIEHTGRLGPDRLDEPATIDLGEMTKGGHPSIPDPLAPRAVARWWRGLRPAAARRWIGTALVGVVLVATAAGGARPHPPLDEVFSTSLWQQGQFDLSGEALLVLRVSAGGASLAGYRLADGALRWETPVDVRVQPDGYASAFVGDGVVVLTTGGRSQASWTEGYDLGTGARLWRRPGQPWFGAHAHLVLARPLDCPDGPACVGAIAPQGQEMVGIDGRTGSIRWTLRMPAELGYAASYDWSMPETAAPPRLATIDQNGRLTVYDARTGAIVGRRDVPPKTQPAVRIIGHRLLVPVADGIAAFDTLRVAPLWTVRASLLWEGNEIWPCGRLLCVAADGGTLAIEPEDGRVRWRLPGLVVAGGIDDRYALAYQVGADGGVEMRPGAGTAEVIALESGQRVFPARGWEPFGPAAGGRRAWMQWWNANRTQMWLGELRSGSGAVATVGTVKDVRDYCLLKAPFLACHSAGQTVRVSRLTG